MMSCGSDKTGCQSTAHCKSSTPDQAGEATAPAGLAGWLPLPELQSQLGQRGERPGGGAGQVGA